MALRKEEIIQRYDENQVLESLVGAEQIDMAGGVIRNIPPFSQTGTLFAQTTLYWRSYFYRQQLARARYICDGEAQERVLTHLLINLSLLTKDSSRESKADRAAWIIYLKNYAEDMSLAIKNRLLANALWLALDVKHTEAQWNKFVCLLQKYCFRVPETKTNFYHSLLLIVARACGDELVADHPLDFNEFLNSRINDIVTLFEAQIILAPYTTQFSLENGEIIADIEKAFIKQHDSGLNYICVLHAALHLIPIISPFWQNPEEVLGYVSKHTELLYKSVGVISLFNYERMNLFITLMARTGINLATESWKTRLDKRHHADLAERLYMDLLLEASEMASLYHGKDTSDKKRIDWLKNVTHEFINNNALISFTPRIFARLKTDAARREAVDMLMNYEWRKQSGHRYQDITINLIKTLILTQQLSDEKIKAGALHFETVCRGTSTYSDMDALLPAFDFLDDKQYLTRLNKNITAWHNKRFVFADLCQHLKASELQAEWLAKFKRFLDETSLQDGIPQFSLRYAACKKAYTVLLCKLANKQEIAGWNYQLISTFDTDPGAYLGLIKIMLPHLELADKIAWMDLLLRACFGLDELSMSRRQSRPFCDDLLECVAIGMATLPMKNREKYSQQISLCLPTPIFRDQRSNVELYINLFQQLCDEHITSLEQRVSFVNTSQPSGVATLNKNEVCDKS